MLLSNTSFGKYTKTDVKLARETDAVAPFLRLYGVLFKDLRLSEGQRRGRIGRKKKEKGPVMG